LWQLLKCYLATFLFLERQRPKLYRAHVGSASCMKTHAELLLATERKLRLPPDHLACALLRLPLDESCGGLPLDRANR
jgi:hypothetical protein